MIYISSDTNVWLDFYIINRLDYPFRLPYIYIMNQDTIEDELLSPKNLGEQLIALGLESTEINEEEFYLAAEYMDRYARPSKYDCIALAIAKVRGIILLSGDGPLRKAANAEGVKVMGTIEILDQLYELKKISQIEYIYCLKELQNYNGNKVRLPANELKSRIEKNTTKQKKV